MIWVDLFNSWVVLLLILAIVIVGWVRGVRVYEEFIKGAKEGFNVVVMIIPYLIAVLCAVAVFQSGGAMDLLTRILRPATNLAGVDPALLPLALLKPLSGSGARGIMLDIWDQHGGPDSLIGYTASIMQGSAETTFYVLAVYCGAVGVRKTRGVLTGLLIGDLAGFSVAILLARFFYPGQ